MKIIDYYLSKDITILFYDLYGSSPDRHYPSINMLMRKINAKQKESKENIFITATNVKYGRPLRRTLVAPAKDMFSFYMGFDAFSRAHVMKIGGLPPIKRPPHYRMFHKEDYGYYRGRPHRINQLPSELRLLFKDDEELENLDDRYLNEVIKTYNCYDQGLEANIIRNNIMDEIDLTKYLKQKDYMPEEHVKEILKLYNEPVQTLLF